MTETGERGGGAGRSLRWLGAEILVVVVGILIAFQFEAWRNARQDRADEASALEAVLGDLVQDSAGLESFAAALVDQGAAVRRLVVHFGGGARLSEDSLTMLYHRSTVSFIWDPVAPTYRGLRESGRLGLLADDEIRRELIQYYDEWEVYLGQLADELGRAGEELRDVAARDIVATLPDGREDAEYVYELLHPLDRIPTHPDFRGRLGTLGRWVEVVRSRVRSGLVRNSELRNELRERLAVLE